MSGLLPVSGLAARFLAVMLGVAAVATLVRYRPSVPEMPAPSELSTAAAASTSSAPPSRRLWRLGLDGWFIRVDGAEVAIPTFAELTASRPRASLAWSFSPFDQLIVQHANAEGFDWRLVAALIFEESRFDPNSESDRGAVGLMQVRPIAAEAVGEEASKDPDENIRTGVRYLAQLDDMFSEAHGGNRLGLVLAAYNIGPGHVRDAQALARRFGYDPNRWEDGVDLMLPLLERPAVYASLTNGFGKGSDTVAYVQRILERYERYQREAPADRPNPNAVSSSKAASSHG
jgi:soluble lytic murein transglycosylase-like protein